MIYGHEDKVRAFKNLARNGRLGHAYLFFGDAQTGKRLFAESLAHFLEGESFEIRERPLFDAKVFGPDQKGIIGIDTALEVRRFLWQAPFSSPKRLVIIDKSEVLTKEAQSALLKIVEEPPQRAMIIFIAKDTQVLFPPLLSRMAKIYFSRLRDEDVRQILIKHYKVNGKKAEEVASIAFGRMGRALSLLREDTLEPKIENELEETILRLRTRDLYNNSRILSWLLNRLELMGRYNLNLNLQKRAADYKIAQK